MNPESYGWARIDLPLAGIYYARPETHFFCGATISVSADRPTKTAFLSGRMYELARALTASLLAGSFPESGLLAPAASYALAVVILSHACLEAYLNEFLLMWERAPSAKWAAAISELQRANLHVKWALAAQIFAGKSFDKAAEPYQSFALLIALRNELVHYDPEFRPIGTFPSKKIESLSSKFEFAYPRTADWTTQVLNVECARWACRTVREMIKAFHELVGGPDLTSFEPWSDPP